MADDVARLQKSILREYASSVGLAPDPHYLGGARLRPVVPLDTATGGVFILGAYPSARFESIGGESDVPVGDNLGPFEPERYFDGTRVRTQASADELAEFYLKPLGIERRACWVTDIVKVFLFKEGHRDKYLRLGHQPPEGYERERFEELALKSMPWLERELVVAKPKLMISLGREIAGLLRGVTSDKKRNDLLEPTVRPLRVGAIDVQTVHLAHPGIVMRKRKGQNDPEQEAPKNPWPRRHAEEHVPELRRALPGLLGWRT